MKINRSEAVRRLEAARETGWFCSVKAERRTDDPKDPSKKKGDIRIFNCRGGVRKHLVGGNLPYDPDKHKLIVIWDQEGYRSIPIEGIKEMTIEGEHFVVEGK
jgi:hypothetical protein